MSERDTASAGDVARRLGVAVTTLRTWHQRYGLGPSAHSPGRHRRYTQTDIALLDRMVRLIAHGLPAAEAARVARAHDRDAATADQAALDQAALDPTTTDPVTTGLVTTGPTPADLAAEEPVTTDATPADLTTKGPVTTDAVPERTTTGKPTTEKPTPEKPTTGASRTGGHVRRAAVVRHGGGHAIPVGRADPAARGLARAAMRLDTAAMGEIITTALRDRGVAGAWDDVARPVLAGLGRRHAATGELIEVEHLLSRCLSEAFTAVPRPDDRPRPPRLLLACTEDEQHTLPLEALAAALAQDGCPSRLLGPRVPAAALAAAIRRTRPTAVVLWSQTEATADPRHLLACRPDGQRPLVIAAGPGWSDLDPTVERPADLTAAAALVRPLARVCAVGPRPDRRTPTSPPPPHW